MSNRAGQIDRIVGSQGLNVVMVSYTGSRLLVWVLSPGGWGLGEEDQEGRLLWRRRDSTGKA